VVPVLHVTETQQEISRQVIEESLRTGMHPERRARLKALQDSQSQCEGGLPRLAPPPLDPLDPLIQSLTTQEALTMLTHSIRDFLQALEEALRPMMSAVRTATEAMNRVRPTSKVPFWADAPQNRRRRG
jgi:hypothetical protein